MSSARGHRLEPVTGTPPRGWATCSTPRCQQPTTHFASYEYVTGRAGRVSTARRALCSAHAARFADRHDLDHDQ